MQSNFRDFPISREAAEKLISAHDGDVALLYIYMQSRQVFDLEAAAGELCRTLREVDAAYEKLTRLGLTQTETGTRSDNMTATKPENTQTAPRPSTKDKLPPPEELPEYSAEDITIRARTDTAFVTVLNEAQRLLGHVLGSADLRKLFGIYDYLAIPPEVLLTLLNHCVSVAEARYGIGRKPSMRQIEKEAYAWVRMEILTLERAESYIQKYKLRNDDRGRIIKLLGISGRELVPTERDYINAWLDMGMSEELIALALDRTVSNTGALKWGYMNKVLQSWHEKGIQSPAELEKSDPPHRSPTAASGSKAESIDINALRSRLDKM